MSYSPELTRAIRRALYRLRWKLGRAWGERVVLVGGLVPPFLVPDPPPEVDAHVGTSDIDLAVGLFAPEEEAYVSLVRAMRACGFRQRQPKEPSFRWFGRQDGAEIVLEILCPKREAVGQRIRRRVESDGGSDLSALQVRGVELAALDFVVVRLDEHIAELGDRGPIELRVVGPTTFLALKAQALADVDKPKHAYDVVWLCDAWPHESRDPNGASALANAIRSSAVIENPFVRDSLRVLRNLFSTPDAPGPAGYASTVGGDTTDRDRARLYARGLLNEFFSTLDRGEP